MVETTHHFVISKDAYREAGDRAAQDAKAAAQRLRNLWGVILLSFAEISHYVRNDKG